MVSPRKGGWSRGKRWLLFCGALVAVLSISNLWTVLSMVGKQENKSLWRSCSDQIRKGSTMDTPSCHEILSLSASLSSATSSSSLSSSVFSSSVQQQQEPQQASSRGTSHHPTHHACDGYDGLLHIAMGDIGGAAGTVFFQFVVGQLLYAERYNLKPWIHFNNVSSIIYDEVVHGQGPGVTLKIKEKREAITILRAGGYFRDRVPGPPTNLVQGTSQQVLHFKGTGVWEHYFEPISDFVPGDKSCEKVPYVTLTLEQITPGIHGFAPWAPRCWRYHYLPDYVTKPHIPLGEWLAPHLKLGAKVVRKYIRFKPDIYAAAQRVNPGCRKESPCLGLHIRHSDKSAGRRVIPVAEFLPFARAFVHEGGQHIYLATDSSIVLEEIRQSWPTTVTEKIRTMGHAIVRSSDKTPVFDMGAHDRTNREILIEIAALSSCQYFVHGLSAVSDSALWLNEDLQSRSVNLEVNEHMKAVSFGALLQMELRGLNRTRWPGPDGVPIVSQNHDWWKISPRWLERETSSHDGKACDGYDGVLHIQSVSPDAATAGAFFTDIINQLLLAEKFNLLPWIHLVPEAYRLYDATSHGMELRKYGLRVNNTLHKGMVKGILTDNVQDATLQEVLVGNGVWDSYFAPVSRFTLDDASCRGQQVASLNSTAVARLSLWSTSVRAWRYDFIPDDSWPTNGNDLTVLFRQMRQRGVDLVRKYFRLAPHLKQKAEEVNPMPPGTVCLAIHVRHTGKAGKYRRSVAPDEYTPYVEEFIKAGGDHIYIGTDSRRYLLHMNNSFTPEMLSKVRTQGERVVRMSKKWPPDMIDDHHRVNSEVLVDIEAMSRCQFFLHSYSTVPEAVIYMNPSLQNTSVNLEDPSRLTPEAFGAVAKQIMGKNGQEKTPMRPSERITHFKIQRDSVNGAEIIKSDTGRLCRSNAVVYLAQKIHSSYQRDSYGHLLRSINLLQSNYLSLHNHSENVDIFIFHTSDFDEEDLRLLEGHFDPSFPGILRLVNLTGSSYWRRPKHLEGDNPESWNAYPLFSEGYRRMIHFFAIDIWQFFADYTQQTGCTYRYIMRLDEDSYIHSPINYNVFAMMQNENYSYGFRMCAYEMHIIRNIWTMFRRNHPSFVPKRDINYQMCGFYNNFFVADIQFFQSEAVARFLKFVDHRGAIYRRRLGDLLIHSTAVYAFAEEKAIHRFLDFTYEHGTINHTSGHLMWGGIQAGYNDPNWMSTLDEYYERVILQKNGEANGVMLFEDDLSPTYQHGILPTYRGELSLLTITAGLVELPGMGVLSG